MNAASQKMLQGRSGVELNSASPMLFEGQEMGPDRSVYGVKKNVHAKLASVSNPILVNRPDLVDQMTGSIQDRYYLDDGGYELGENEVAVDLFCGAGGTSEGMVQALGEGPAFAVNHNPDAIGVHAVNHPETIHLESDVFAADPEAYLDQSKSIGLLACSPSCTHFSGAKGGAPRDAGIRDQAWIAVHWAEHPNPRFRPRVIILENVREYLTWAPLTAEGKINKRFIDKQGLGSTFKEWRQRLIDANYQVEYKILNAADFGVATKRKRLFVVARRDGLPIRFPTPTHGPRTSNEVLAGKLQPYRPASDCIDFTIQCNPIFMYAADAKAAGANRPLAPNTLTRIAAGVERFVIDADDPFIVSYYGPKNGINFRGQPIADPLPTQTTENRFAIVNPLISPITHTGPGRYYDMHNQLPTITTAKRGELAIISPVYCQAASFSIAGGALIPLRRETSPVSLNGLLPTLTGHSQMALAVGEFVQSVGQTPMSINTTTENVADSVFAAPFIAGAGGSEYAGKPRSVSMPINTLKCDNRSAVIVPTLVRVAHGSIDRFGKKRGRGDHDICEPLPTQSTSNEFAVVEPFLVTTGYGERKGQAPRIHDLADPIGTMVACGMKHALVEPGMVQIHFKNANSELDRSSHVFAAHMAQQNEGNVGHPVTEPVSTMTTKVCHQNLVTSHLLTLRQNGIGQALSEPLSAFCAAGNHHGEVRACFVKYYSQGGQYQPADEPLDTLTTKPRFAIVQVPVEELGLTEDQRFEAWWIARFLEMYGTKEQGNPNTEHLSGPRPSVVGRPGAVLWTIQMRMLVPKEASAASSFPEDYVLDRTADGRNVSKTTMMQLIGNAVPPGLGAAIIGANVKPRRSVARAMNDNRLLAA
jgi:DNA (cytosine-5)-methyltransferase 1